jgi:predicted metal-dependent HD superfamily phosphohydrolase
VTAPGARILAALLDCYAEPHRAYHTLQHLEECFAQLDAAVDLAERPGEIAIALWFHDAVYDTHRADNEARSADWAREVVTQSGGSDEVALRVSQLVLATRHSGAPAEPDARLLVDIDLAIFAAEPDRYDEYERQIRFEYQWVPEGIFRDTRRRILSDFLARARIYTTVFFADRCEHSARRNLQRAIAHLGG